MYIGFRCVHITLTVLLTLSWMIEFYVTEEDLVITVNIEENTAVGRVVSTLFKVIVPRPRDDTSYTLMKNPYFSITNRDHLIVIGEIDRDNDHDLCMERTQNHSCIWKHILVSSTNLHLVLKVIIEDQNDNSPNWVDSSTRIEITENVIPKLYKLELAKARDPDESPNDTVLYVIEPPSKYVSIVNETSSNGLTPYLILRQTIDRELINSHNVTLLAIDGGNPPRTGSLTLLIKIVDVNDNHPVFESSIYKHSLNSSNRVNDRLDLRIRATDSDEGLNGNITYSFSVNSPFVVQDCFRIDPDTAIIVVLKSLSGSCYLHEYHISVTASDKGNPVLSTKTSVILTFESQNVYPPDIQMSNKEPKISLFENNVLGKVLRTIAVKDKDLGVNGQFKCLIRGDQTNNLSITFSMSNMREMAIIQLVALGSFDRETISKIYVTIVCKDLGKPSLTSTKDLIIDILDVNDNTPHFKKDHYHFKAYEENEPYQKLAQLTAFDDDEGNNSMLTYHIESTTFDEVGSRLAIDIHGHIIAKERLDREVFANGFNFTVVATDQGSPSLSGSTKVYLELLDVNDNNPIFSRDYYNFSFTEDVGNRHQSRVVGRVTARDVDLNHNSIVTYTLAPTTPIPFKLNPESGELYSYSLVDREAHTSPFVFGVLAMDNPTNLLYRRTSIATVSIQISDYNDNRPSFVFPNDENNRVHLSYSSSVGTLVATVKATDKDSGFNSRITYSFVDPERNVLFSINRSSGELTISTVLNSIHEGVENLFIRASDSGSPPLSAVQRLVIEIGEYKPPFSGSIDNHSNSGEPFLSDQATYIIVAIVLGTFFICCGLVTGICTMTYRQWRTSRNRASSMRQYVVAAEDPANLQIYVDNYLDMKEFI